MRKATIIRLVAALILIGVVIFFVWQWLPRPPRPNVALHQGIGQVMAQQALSLLGPGGQLIVVVRDTSEVKAPATDIQLQAFRQVCRQAGQPVALTRLIRVDPLRPVAVPAGDFAELLRKTSTNDVVVSFMGPPPLNNPALTRLRGRHARVVALCTGPIPNQVNLRQLFANGLLHAAVVDRREASLTALKPTMPQAWFDLFYRLVTATNQTEAPAPQAAGL
jgi:hypothetical protein